MFWRIGFHASKSPLQSQLDKEDVTVEDILDQEDLLQEVKANNKKLLQYLSRADVVHKLIYYLTEWEEDADEKRKYKFPLLACEILAADLPSVLEVVVQETSLTQLFNFLDRETPLPPQLSLNFVRVIQNVYTRKPQEVSNFLQQQPASIATNFLHHIETFGINELMLTLLGAMDEDERPDQGQTAHRWLQFDLVPQLFQQLTPERSTDVHINTIRMLSEIVRRFHNPSVARLAEVLMTASNVKQFLALMMDDLKRDPKSTVFTEGTNLLITIVDSLVRREELLLQRIASVSGTAASDTSNEFSGLASIASAPTSNNNGNGNADAAASSSAATDTSTSSTTDTPDENSGDNTTENANSESNGSTESTPTETETSPPCENNNSTTSASSSIESSATENSASAAKEAAYAEMQATKETFSIIMARAQEMIDFLKNPGALDPVTTTFGVLSPPLGMSRLKIVELLLVMLKTKKVWVEEEAIQLDMVNICLDLFFRYDMNNLLHILVEDIVSTCMTASDDTIKHLFNDCQLVARITQAVQEDEKMSQDPKAMRKGYFGHITNLSNKILQLEQNPVVQPHTKEEGFQEYVTGALATRNENDSHVLGGGANILDKHTFPPPPPSTEPASPTSPSPDPQSKYFVTPGDDDSEDKTKGEEGAAPDNENTADAEPAAEHDAAFDARDSLTDDDTPEKPDEEVEAWPEVQIVDRSGEPEGEAANPTEAQPTTETANENQQQPEEQTTPEDVKAEETAAATESTPKEEEKKPEPEEEEVLDFNQFNFWRINPADLVSSQ
eukprot:TRINITY_DN59413_c0_g1_i1.p1 TRINITY_DN59413_c0_g1~~TRINITY_DN59413_c0_g1_i1.p1  ORF type:complete len:788 (-),score=143.05 TRINITY_DN59413_c0_g1_i1:351-2714(-)